MKPKILVLWHEPSNMIGTCEIKHSSLPLIEMQEEEFHGINPFYAYPMWYLTKYVGWHVLGEL